MPKPKPFGDYQAVHRAIARNHTEIAAARGPEGNRPRIPTGPGGRQRFIQQMRQEREVPETLRDCFLLTLTSYQLRSVLLGFPERRPLQQPPEQ